MAAATAKKSIQPAIDRLTTLKNETELAAHTGNKSLLNNHKDSKLWCDVNKKELKVMRNMLAAACDSSSEGRNTDVTSSEYDEDRSLFDDRKKIKRTKKRQGQACSECTESDEDWPTKSPKKQKRVKLIAPESTPASPVAGSKLAKTADGFTLVNETSPKGKKFS